MIYIGSYSAPTGDGIYSFDLDSDTGRLTSSGKPIRAVNPSYLAVSHDHRFLYTVSETTRFQGKKGGSVCAYQISKSGELLYKNTVSTGGCDPCHLSTDSCGAYLAAANYSSGSFSLFPLKANGEIEPCSVLIRHQGSGPDKQRQEMAHVHFTAFTPDGRFLCAVDLGCDCVKFYQLNPETGALQEQNSRTISLRPGSGPRHLVFNGRLLYILTELSSETAVFEYAHGHYCLRQTLSTIPPDFQEFAAAAALRLSPDGRYLYASNRGHDSIAAFRVGNDGLLTPSGMYSSEGRWPRDIALDPQGNYLIAANEKSNEVVVFRIDKQSGALMKTACTAVHRPTCILFS